MGFLHAGSVDTADRTLDLVTDKTQMANCLLAFSKYYWDRGEKDEAFEALDESYQILRSQRDIETRDSRSRLALFGSIAAQYAGLEKPERAVEIASTIEDDAQRTSALTQIATILTLQRNDEEARHALNAISDDSDRAFALTSMSDAKQQLGDRPDAVALLGEAVHLVEAIPQLTARSAVYNEIGKRYLEYGESEKAAELFEASLRTIAEVRDEGHRAAAIAALSDLSVDPNLELAEEDSRIVEKLLSQA
jgi:tetratricopeptide (TPR) repeat protein